MFNISHSNTFEYMTWSESRQSFLGRRTSKGFIDLSTVLYKLVCLFVVISFIQTYHFESMLDGNIFHIYFPIYILLIHVLILSYSHTYVFIDRSWSMNALRNLPSGKAWPSVQIVTESLP